MASTPHRILLDERRARGRHPLAMLMMLGTLLSGAVDATDWDQRGDEVAQQIRDSRQAATPAAAQRMLGEAIVLLDAIIASDANATQRRRAMLDRIVALSQLGRWHDALAEFRRLEQASPELPSYVVSAAGDAAAGLQEPELALELYQRALAANPDDDAAHAGRIFALADLDRLDEAEAILAARVDAHGSRDDTLRLALIRAWSGQLDASAKQIGALAENAPEDAELARQQGGLELLRDRPYAALAAYDRSLSAAPGYIGAAVDRIAALDRLGRIAEAEAVIDGLAEDVGEWPLYRRVTERRRHDRGALLDSRVRAGRGGDREIASGEARTETTLWSPVFGPELRAYAAYRRAYADFRGVYLEDERIVGGLRWQAGTVRIQIEADNARDDLVDDGGAALAIEWRIDDRWTVAASAADNAFDLPLRARGAGTTGDRYALAARFSPGGQHWARLSLGRIDYSDGNRRQEVGLIGWKRIPWGHRWALTLSPGLFAGENRRDDVPYFSPLRDASAELGAALEHRIHARLGRQHAQRFEAFAGVYDQKFHAPELIGGLRYEYGFVPAPGRRLFARAGRDRRAYDGTPEYQTFVELGLQYSW